MINTTIPRFALLPILLLFVSVPHEGYEDPLRDGTRNEHLVMSVLWYQRSAEMRALSYQTFALARMRLDADRTGRNHSKKPAVVVDIDETVLNNSPHMGKLILENEVFPYGWKEWVDRAEAEPLPGAVEFLAYAVSQGYDIFYVSNRSADTEMDGTIKNLVGKKFPQADRDHVLLKGKESGKEGRRKSIEQTHEIVLLLGDNLNDLSEVFERKSVSDRSREVDHHRDAFGSRFIVLPNPMYGEWENALYNYARGLTDAQKAEKRKSHLQSF